MSDYAAAFNVNVQELYNGHTQLQRKGLWPKMRKTRVREPQRLAVEVAAQNAATMPAAVNEWLFRISGPGGWVMECRQLPEASWLRELSATLGKRAHDRSAQRARIWLVAGFTDLRRCFDGLSAPVQTRLNQSPFSGELYIFRGRRGDRIKVLWYRQDGLCLFYKRLSVGKFVWPQAENGTVSLSAAQLSMLLEGIDWRHPRRTAPSPQDPIARIRR